MCIFFFILQSLLDKNIYVEINENFIKKLINIINYSELPYFAKYLFVKFIFQKNKHLISKFNGCFNTNNEFLNLCDTQEQRLNAVKKELFPITTNTLIDIGCGGDILYTKEFSKEYKSIIAYELDDIEIEKAKEVLEFKNIKNVTLNKGILSINELFWLKNIDYNVDIILTEVIEHNEQKFSLELINFLLSCKCVNKLIITCPNKDFNKNYFLKNNEFRHNDHIWEPNKKEFTDFIKSVELYYKYIIEINEIGDIVDGESVSFLAIFKK